MDATLAMKQGFEKAGELVELMFPDLALGELNLFKAIVDGKLVKGVEILYMLI